MYYKCSNIPFGEISQSKLGIDDLNKYLNSCTTLVNFKPTANYGFKSRPGTRIINKFNYSSEDYRQKTYTNIDPTRFPQPKYFDKNPWYTKEDEEKYNRQNENVIENAYKFRMKRDYVTPFYKNPSIPEKSDQSYLEKMVADQSTNTLYVVTITNDGYISLKGYRYSEETGKYEYLSITADYLPFETKKALRLKGKYINLDHVKIFFYLQSIYIFTGTCTYIEIDVDKLEPVIPPKDLKPFHDATETLARILEQSLDRKDIKDGVYNYLEDLGLDVKQLDGTFINYNECKLGSLVRGKSDLELYVWGRAKKGLWDARQPWHSLPSFTTNFFNYKKAISHWNNDIVNGINIYKLVAEEAIGVVTTSLKLEQGETEIKHDFSSLIQDWETGAIDKDKISDRSFWVKNANPPTPPTPPTPDPQKDKKVKIYAEFLEDASKEHIVGDTGEVHEGRLWIGDKSTLYGSVPGDFKDFAKADGKDSDAINAVVGLKDVGDIVDIGFYTFLHVFTTSRELFLNHKATEAITTKNFEILGCTSYGSMKGFRSVSLRGFPVNMNNKGTFLGMLEYDSFLQNFRSTTINSSYTDLVKPKNIATATTSSDVDCTTFYIPNGDGTVSAGESFDKSITGNIESVAFSNYQFAGVVPSTCVVNNNVFYNLIRGQDSYILIEDTEAVMDCQIDVNVLTLHKVTKYYDRCDILFCDGTFYRDVFIDEYDSKSKNNPEVFAKLRELGSNVEVTAKVGFFFPCTFVSNPITNYYKGTRSRGEEAIVKNIYFDLLHDANIVYTGGEREKEKKDITLNGKAIGFIDNNRYESFSSVIENKKTTGRNIKEAQVTLSTRTPGKVIVREIGVEI